MVIISGMKTKPQIKSGTDGLHKPNEDQNPNRIPPRWSSKARMMKPSPIEPPINQNIKTQTYTKKKNSLIFLLNYIIMKVMSDASEI